MRKFFEIGGLVAAAVLIAFGVAALVMGVNGRSTVQDSLKLEQIVGSPDMTPSAIAAEAKKAGLPASISLPTTDVAGKPIDTGDRARAFASYMRIHTLEATGGVPYSQMPRFATADGKGTNDATAALQANGRPVDNAARNIWVTETALTTALNTSYMASQLALFGIVVGVALLLSGIGFGILAIGGALRNPDSVLTSAKHKTKTASAKAVPSV
jgi:F0F1-type ATP synthase membrane subunit c/vacuolar-type H+-ATPase subunit K